MNGERFDPLKIVQAFNHRGVEYVVIGGYAGELHAAAVPPTRDIDFTPRATQENLTRLLEVLTDLDVRIRTAGIPEGLPFSHDAESLANVGMWNLTCRFGEFDISFKPSGTDGYEDLVRAALRVDVQGGQMSVASLADIIRSKEAAARAQRFLSPPCAPRTAHRTAGHLARESSSSHGSAGRGTHDQRRGRPAAWLSVARCHSNEMPGRRSTWPARPSSDRSRASTSPTASPGGRRGAAPTRMWRPDSGK